ncbi:MAG: YdcF family protein [Alphaproteobacteria bacterium]|nr:YdcF family protein [Alphaproteobacteria bacterium]
MLKPLLLPPGVLLVLALAGLLRGTRAGGRLAVVAIGLLVTLSLPITARILMTWVEGEWSGQGGEDGAATVGAPAAIIVLAGDYRSFAPEYGEATVGALTLTRLRHGAYLHRKTGLPIALSGGGTPPEHRPGLAAAMRITMERDFGVPVRWVEAVSRNTFENARETTRILKADGVSAAYLVTHAFHMRRAVLAFQAAGLPVRPAPAGGVRRTTELRAGDFMPEPSALLASAHAVHEAVGLGWYLLLPRAQPMTGR